MKALIIGGNRFFGKRLASLLLERDVEVTLLNRGQLDDGLGDRVRRIALDRKLLGKDHPALGDQSWDIVYDQVCYDADEARGACAAFAGKTSRLVLISSQSVYDAGEFIPESTFDAQNYKFTTTVNRDQDYGEAKRQAEAAYFQHADFGVTAVRFPIVLGPDDYTARLAWHIDRIREGKPIYFPQPDVKMSFVHSADAAALLAALTPETPNGSLNCCAAEPVRLRDLVGTIEEKLDRPAEIVNAATQGEVSPFGITDNWYMSVDRLREWGLEVPRPIMDWLPDLVSP